MHQTTGLRLPAAILAGGDARRYGGRAKGFIKAGGSTIVEKLVAELAQAGACEIAIVANDRRAYERFGLVVMNDMRRRIGPLGGIETALIHYKDRYEAVLFLPCDVPGITATEIVALKSAFASRSATIITAETGDFFWHPLCSIVHTGLAERITAAIDQGTRSVRALWRELGAAAVHFDDPRPFFNVNTPEDLARWQATTRRNQ